MPPAPSSSLRLLLTHRAFARLWASQAISTCGDALYDVALLWSVLDDTGSALAAGGIAIMATLGGLLGGLAAGTVVDRFSRRRVMLATDLVRLGLTLGAGLAWVAGAIPPLPVLYGLAFALAVAGACFRPARAAAIPEIVPSERLVAANALDGLSSSLVLTLAWALSGVVVAAVGPARALLLDGLTFLLSFLLVRAARWEEPAPAPGPTAARPGSALGEGLRWVGRTPLMRTVLAIQAVYALAAGCFVGGLAAYLRQAFAGGAVLYGLQGAAFGFGLIVASWLIGLRPARRVGLLYSLGLVVNGLGNTVFALAPAVSVVLAGVFVAGLARAAYATGEQVLLQAHTPPHVRGRIFALSGMLGSTMAMLALAIGGWLADAGDARQVVLVTSLVHLSLGLWLIVRSHVRRAQITL